MICYKPMPKIKALSFDLDDTLYANHPIIARAERAMQLCLQQQLPGQPLISADYWFQIRRQLAREQPQLRHDISQWRLAALEYGLQHDFGQSHCAAADIAELALTTFLRYRTDIRLSAAMVRSLEALAARFPLIAISNGNADIAKMGIAHLFRASLRAGPDGKMKPSADLFQRAVAVLNIEPAHILHVGDHPVADVQGALHAGFSAAWLHQPVQPHPESCMADASDSLHAIEPQPIRHDAKLRQRLTLLPHLEIRDIAELTALV